MDEYGRVGGKINIIDLALIILAAVLLFGFIYSRVTGPLRRAVASNERVSVVFLIEDIPTEAVSAFNNGDALFMRFNQTPLGRIINITENPAVLAQESGGEIIFAPLEGRSNLLITMEADVIILESGLYINGSIRMASGAVFELQNSKVFFKTMVLEIVY